MKRKVHGIVIGLSLMLSAGFCLADIMDADGVADEPKDEGLMRLFEEGDTHESVAEQIVKIDMTLRKDYEKYLITKYAPLNITGEEYRKRMLEVPFSAEARELSDFSVVWHQTLKSSRGSRRNNEGGLGIVPDTEAVRTYNRLFSARDGSSALSEEQREFLNGLIVSKKITAKGPGVLYNSAVPLADEDMAFVEKAVKCNPDIKLPWHDPEWQEEARLARTEWKRNKLMLENQRLLGMGIRDANIINELEKVETEYSELRQKSNEKIKAKRLESENGSAP